MKSFSRILLFAAALAGMSTFAPTEAPARELSRAEIRSMPITQRPSRPGHFYGNSVRRANHRRGG